MADSSSRSGGIGFFGALTILFVGLKLAGLIEWSWWWVLSPLLGSVCFSLAIIGCILLGAILGELSRRKG